MRIIAGVHRGRRLHCPSRGTRPTLDRVREALFSILGDVEGMTVTDLYAGSGALALEALSRGAQRAVVVECDRAACQVIRRNAAAMELRQCRVVQACVEDCRSQLQAVAPLDLVLSDPPWAIAQEALGVVAKAVRGLLSPQARVVIGHAARSPLELEPGLGLKLDDARTWGDSGLMFFSPHERPA